MPHNRYMTKNSKKGWHSSILTLVVLLIIFTFSCPSLHAAITHPDHSHPALLLSSSDYTDSPEAGLKELLFNRISTQPFNMVALGLFVCAIIHTFFTHKFTALAHHLEERHRRQSLDLQSHRKEFEIDTRLETDKSFSAEICHFLGEVEAVFAIWLIPVVAMTYFFFDWHTAVDYIQSRDYTEPMFVVVIMALAATRPIVNFAEQCMTLIAKIGGERPAAWWLTILTVGPILGSFITEPAAMTLCAMLLAKRFYRYKPSPTFAYATLGLLFTNISVGGTLTHFAAPPVLMVAKAWGWDSTYMLTNFGWKSVVGIIISNTLYYLIFFRKFPAIAQAQRNEEAYNTDEAKQRSPVPLWITVIHLLLLAFVIFTNHYPAMFIGAFLLFLAFYQATAPHQSLLVLRGPILVGCFLGGLVIHGGLQEWWISAVLQKINESALMISAITLTAFNDNAAITYLTTLVPNFTESMKYAVVSGAVAGGGLTVIANAPNPAGFSLLGEFFEDGVSPMGLFLSAFAPTCIVSLCLAFL